MVTSYDLHALLTKFVKINTNVTDVQWDRRMRPQLLFNPYSKEYEEKKKTAHYFLLAASILDDQMVGFSENARNLLINLHKKFETQRLFEITKPHLFNEEIIKYSFYNYLGPRKETIAETLAAVNIFVKFKAERDLIRYSQKFAKPKDFVEELTKSIERMRGIHKDKAWTYMRWMVRPEPDLELFKQYKPEDLLVPLTKENASVAISLGLIKTTMPYLWKDENTALNAQQKITDYAKQIFPKDPAKIDYPLFLLGRWLKRKNLNRNTLKEALQFFEQIQKVTGQPQAHYQKLSRYKSGWEKETARILMQMHIPYGYETITFPLPGDQYTPDFILDKEINGRKIVLEPHYEMNLKQSSKYSLFKQTYGHKFMLILLLKNDLITFFNKRNILTNDVCDDVWPIEFVGLLIDKIKTGEYGQDKKIAN
ncbi:MAG: DUF2400 family protein [Candidatus Bathyarchaeota archaeon]|jgi:hypothetical protein|uniref:DUF2400 family protein n=1 Tax=Candidatus Bathycorpusculum sp. TaxID=2994959 RepID=UPI00281C4BF6|nr:DUF2400 family protein [Candidatus Termiticorpusculum sp.]MCL2257278.1 DUF2400 family protein [Candidatus Termiticorpusculum sp.]MCL2292586.1 DUF2400 family protein [Candidatus Termiticorpusculum sp.]